VQTQRQRDKSLRLKDEFDRITQWTETMIRKPEMGGQSSSTDEDRIIAGSDDGLALSMACLHVGLKRKQSRRFEAGRFDGKFQSFKVIAACCVIRELDAAMKRGKRGPDGASKKGTYFSRG
jgi:hypothetical protein